jgi:hypothetical protein
MRRSLALVAFALVALPAGAHAAESPDVELGGSLGYAFPSGVLERGSRVRDVTFGAPLVSVDGAARVHPLLSLGAGLSYGIVIPTLCVTASDCTASTGHDFVTTLLARFHLGRWRAFEPSVDGALGYEWLGVGLSDEGVSSRRAYRGFVAAFAGDAMLRVSPRVALGVRFELRGGTFHRASLVAPGVDVSRPTDGDGLHFWPILAFRVAVRL